MTHVPYVSSRYQIGASANANASDTVSTDGASV